LLRATLVGTIGLAILGLLAGPSSAVSPRSLFRALVAKTFVAGELLSGSPPVVPSAARLTANLRRFRAIGQANVSIFNGRDGVTYIVFPTAGDTHQAWLSARRAGEISLAGSKFPQNAVFAERRVVKSSAGRKLTVYATQVSFATGNTIVGSFARDLSKSRSRNAALALAQAALAHLRRVEGHP
jgi:hypothetical protein